MPREHILRLLPVVHRTDAPMSYAQVHPSTQHHAPNSPNTGSCWRLPGLLMINTGIAPELPQPLPILLPKPHFNRCVTSQQGCHCTRHTRASALKDQSTPTTETYKPRQDRTTFIGTQTVSLRPDTRHTKARHQPKTLVVLPRPLGCWLIPTKCCSSRRSCSSCRCYQRSTRRRCCRRRHPAAIHIQQPSQVYTRQGSQQWADACPARQERRTGCWAHQRLRRWRRRVLGQAASAL